MAKIWQDPSRVYERVYRVSKESADGTVALVQKKLATRSAHPYATGSLASTYRIEVEEVSPDGVRQTIRSDSPYASAIENGAWVGGRGPHISSSSKGRKEVRDTVRRDFGRRLTKGLRTT